MKIYNLTISLHLFASIFQTLIINYAKLHFPLRYVALCRCCALVFLSLLSFGVICEVLAIAFSFVGDQIGHDVTIYMFHAIEEKIDKEKTNCSL
jgi:hypothetical protein